MCDDLGMQKGKERNLLLLSFSSITINEHHFILVLCFLCVDIKHFDLNWLNAASVYFVFKQIHALIDIYSKEGGCRDIMYIQLLSDDKRFKP